jgi:hypothetical protein
MRGCSGRSPGAVSYTAQEGPVRESHSSRAPGGTRRAGLEVNAIGLEVDLDSRLDGPVCSRRDAAGIGSRPLRHRARSPAISDWCATGGLRRFHAGHEATAIATSAAFTGSFASATTCEARILLRVHRRIGRVPGGTGRPATFARQRDRAGPHR